MHRPVPFVALSLLLACAGLGPIARASGARQAAPAVASAAGAQEQPSWEEYLRLRYDKREVMIPMRDGVRLYTAVYTPKEAASPFALLLRRTPYSCRPYGPDAFPAMPGPSERFSSGGRYAFVLQDVRGCYLSEGEFEDMRPHRPDKQPGQTDESTDTWDTIEWLVRNVEGHNGKVGMWGISYPGFYAATGMIDAHPALAAVSPQAPIADWWWDDFHHHGALFLPHAFLFFSGFGRPRPEPTTMRPGRIDPGTADGWRWFLDIGPLSEAGERWMDGEVRFWDQAMAHPNRDAFWQARDLVPHLENVAPAVMTVGGWFDAEDLYGPLAIHRSIEERNPGIFNVLVMGPWSHGAWARTDGEALGQARFGARTGEFFRQLEWSFFDHYLRGGLQLDLPEALVFETGANRWRGFDAWPPTDLRQRRLVLMPGGTLELADGATPAPSFDEFVSDPDKPVPHTAAIVIGMNREYMTEDQRFAARRPDVLVYETGPLESDVTLAGPLLAELRVATTGTDADWIVKLVDVFPPDASDPVPPEGGQRMSGYHMLVRGEVMPGRFREGYDHPVSFVPDEPATVRFQLWDVLHTFRAGHRVQVQVQSTWFPLVARNPQVFLDNPYTARKGDYRKQTHRVHHGSSLRVGVLPAGD